MITFKKSIAVCVAASLLTSSFAFAATAKKEALMNMGPNQIIREGKTFLWENAYRVDKELVGYTESHSEQNYNSTSSNSENSTSGGINPVKMVSGAVVGGLLGGFLGPAFGIGTKVAAYGAGALAAGLLSGDPKSESESKNSTNTNVQTKQDVSSRTYQVHEKANTWAMIVIDKKGYLAAREEMKKNSNTFAGNTTCAKQGVNLLDSVIADYKVADQSDYESFSSMIATLNVQAEKEAVRADINGTTSAINEKIDEFSEQRIRIISLSWKDILNRSKNCDASANNLEEQVTALYNDILKTSLIVEVNSIAQIPLASKVKSKSSLNAGNAAILKASQVRMAVNYARTLKNLQDADVIEVVKEKSRSRSGNHTKVVVKDMERYLKLVVPTTSTETSSAGSFAGENVALAIGGSATLTVMGGSLFLFGAFADDTTIAVSGGALVPSAMVSLATSLTNAYLRDKNTEQIQAQRDVIVKAMLADLQKNADLDRRLNNTMTQTHRLFGLENVPATLTQQYKSLVAAGIVNNAIEAGGKGTKVGVNYVAFLRESKVLTQKEINDMALILEVMKDGGIIAKNADYSNIGLAQAEEMKNIAKGLLKETTNTEDRAGLERLATNLENEIKILNLLK